MNVLLLSVPSEVPDFTVSGTGRHCAIANIVCGPVDNTHKRAAVRIDQNGGFCTAHVLGKYGLQLRSYSNFMCFS